MARLPRRQATTAETSRESVTSKTSPTSASRRTEDTILTDTRQTTTQTSPKHSDVSSQTTQSAVAVDGPLTTATSPLPVSSSSSIQWGPGITAPSLKSPLPSQSPSPDSSMSSESSEFTDGSRKALIATTTIGGTLILIFLIYALWRRRQGATYSEIVTFKRHSGTIALSSPREERLTALPIYRESRYSVRSSKIGSTPSLPNKGRYPSGVPSAAAQRFYKQNPWLQDVKRDDEPPPPTMTEHLRAQYTPSQGVELPAAPVPAMTRVYSAQSSVEALPSPSKHSSSDNKPRPSISIHPTSELSSSPPSPQGPSADNRWSWTNSQAPPTPRLRAPSLSSRRSSVPRFRKVKSWVRNQADRQALRIDEERGTSTTTRTTSPTTGGPRPTLKNQASKPNLAPKVTRKLSKKSAVRERERESMLVIQGEGVPVMMPEAVRRGEGWR